MDGGRRVEEISVYFGLADLPDSYSTRFQVMYMLDLGFWVFLFVDLFTYTIVECPYVIHDLHWKQH